MHLPALRSREGYEHSRMDVDLGSTGFWEGHEFRLSYELDFVASFVIKFSCSVDFILQTQKIDVDQDGLKFTAYRSTQGVAGGAFSTDIDFFANNFMSDTQDYTTKTTITTGGTFTPNVGQNPVEIIRAVTATASAKHSTIEATAGDERGLAAGSYYLVFDVLAGTNPAGVYQLKWEERPNV